VPPKYLLTAAIVLTTLAAEPQQAPEASTQPQVKVNMLNVCTPSAAEQKEISEALARIPTRPSFADDFEISHGRSTLDQPPNFLQPGQNAKISDEPSVASYVRIRREFAGDGTFANVQYSFSNDGQNMVETLVLHVRDPKELIQVSMEDSASAIGTAESMVMTNTPASRIRLERFGKSSIALARCGASENGPAPDQSAYQPLFDSASQVLADYRKLLSARRMVPAELAQIPSAWNHLPATRKPAKAAETK
jgi:CDGSH-type Zn-finger protein